MENIKISDCKMQRLYNRKSQVWRYFGFAADLKGKVLDDAHYYCEVCFEELKHKENAKLSDVRRFKSSTSTSNFTSHLSQKHDIYLNNMLTSGSSSITSYVISGEKRKCLGFKEKKKLLTDDLTVWFCRDLLPFGKVESPGLYEFLHKYNIVKSPNELPKARTLSNNGLERVYREVETFIKRKTKSVTNFALAADMWTDSCRRMKYIGITLHCISDDVLINMNLATLAFPESHTSENIFVKIYETCKKFDLDINKCYIVRDCGRNIVAACRDNGLKSHSCIGHGLHNLITVDGFKKVPELTSLFDKMKEIHSNLRYKNAAIREKNDLSTQFSYQGPSTQSEPDLDCEEVIESLTCSSEYHELIPDEYFDVACEFDIADVTELENTSATQDGEEVNFQSPNGSVNSTQQTSLKSYCPTRWHSFLLMIKSMIENATAINILVNEGDRPELTLTKKDLNLMRKLADFLQSFKDTVDFLSRASQPTINMALLLRCQLESILAPSHEDCSEIANFKKQMLNAFNHRFPVTELLIIASILDPKFKDLNVIHNYCEEHFTDRKNLIKKYYRQMIGSYEDEYTDDHDPGVMTQLARKFSTRAFENTAFDLEIDAYLHSKDERDVLKYWQERKVAWPKLYEISQAILAIPATSVPVERLFSIAGLTLTKKRCQLEPVKVNKILFIHDNYKFTVDELKNN